MKRNAIRRPRPVFRTPRAMKNAHNTIQTMGSAYPRSDSAGVNVRVTAIATTPRKTTAPAESGCTMDPTIVAAKIANSRQETVEIPSGAPNERMMNAVPKTAAQRQIRPEVDAAAGGSPGTGGPDGFGIGRKCRRGLEGGMGVGDPSLLIADCWVLVLAAGAGAGAWYGVLLGRPAQHPANRTSTQQSARPLSRNPPRL